MKCFDQKLLIFAKKKKGTEFFLIRLVAMTVRKVIHLSLKKWTNYKILKDCALSRSMEKKHQSTCKIL